MEKLLSSNAARLTNYTDGNKAINASLAEMGGLVDTDRAYVFLLREHGALMDNTHEWCAPGVSPEIENLQGLPSGNLHWFMEKLRKGIAFQIADVSALPPAAERYNLSDKIDRWVIIQAFLWLQNTRYICRL